MKESHMMVTDEELQAAVRYINVMNGPANEAAAAIIDRFRPENGDVWKHCAPTSDVAEFALRDALPHFARAIVDVVLPAARERARREVLEEAAALVERRAQYEAEVASCHGDDNIANRADAASRQLFTVAGDIRDLIDKQKETTPW